MSNPQIEAVYEAQQRAKGEDVKTDGSVMIHGPMDPEFLALNTCAQAISGLPHEAKQRVIGYLSTRFNITPTPSKQYR